MSNVFSSVALIRMTSDRSLLLCLFLRNLTFFCCWHLDWLYWGLSQYNCLFRPTDDQCLLQVPNVFLLDFFVLPSYLHALLWHLSEWMTSKSSSSSTSLNDPTLETFSCQRVGIRPWRGGTHLPKGILHSCQLLQSLARPWLVFFL